MSAQTSEEIANAIVARIEADFTDRRGLRQEWDEIDADLQEEIRDTWRDIVRQELSQLRAALNANACQHPLEHRVQGRGQLINATLCNVCGDYIV